MGSKLNSLTEGKIASKCNFSNALIGDMMLKNTNLIGVNLAGANLVNANLIDAQLFKANFNGANLSDAFLHDAKINGAYLINANLHNTGFLRTYFRGVDVLGAKGLTVKQLKQARSLYGIKNLPLELEEQLRKEKPCLFTLSGCKF